jgi:hypothetical protein
MPQAVANGRQVVFILSVASADAHFPGRLDRAQAVIEFSATRLSISGEPIDYAARSENEGLDPGRCSIVASFSRPGGNVTGVNVFTVELTPKGLQWLRELVPKAGKKTEALTRAGLKVFTISPGR